MILLPAEVNYERIIDMNYENFIEAVSAAVSLLCPNDKVRIEKITKNNTTIWDAIVIFRENDCVSPTIYLMDYYLEYSEGKEIDEIAEEIVRISENSRGMVKFDVDACNSFEGIKDKLLCRVVNYKQNRELLSKCPHRSFLDLALVYYCVETDCNGDFGSWLITDKIFSDWNVTEEVLYKKATENLPKLMPPELINIWDMLERLTGEPYIPENGAEDKMYVLTNDKKIYGATSILFEDLIKKFAKDHGSFYILPSSIHEVILVPTENDEDAVSLKNMVIEVNETKVHPTEYLSDEVYFFDAVEQEIRRLII